MLLLRFAAFLDVVFVVDFVLGPVLFALPLVPLMFLLLLVDCFCRLSLLWMLVSDGGSLAYERELLLAVKRYRLLLLLSRLQKSLLEDPCILLITKRVLEKW